MREQLGGQATGGSTNAGDAAKVAPGKQTLTENMAGPGDRDRQLVLSMIKAGKKDESGLTNAVFYARHPELQGKAVAKGSAEAKEWIAIREELVRPALQGKLTLAPPAVTASGSTATATTATETPAVAPHEHGLVDMAVDAASIAAHEVADAAHHALDTAHSMAHGAYERVAGWFDSDPEVTPATPKEPEVAEEVAPAAPAAETPDAAAPPADFKAGMDMYKTKTATVAGDTLEIANTQAAKGDKGTKYNRSGTKEEMKAVLKKLLDGDKDATEFWCSGLSIWTLAAAGYDMSKPISGKNGKPITYTKVHETIDKKTGKPKETEEKVTLKDLIDGAPTAVGLMARTTAEIKENGGSVGKIDDIGGHAGAYKEDGTVLDGAKGAVAMFKAAGIGDEVPEADQKPGDFAQSRKKSIPKDKDGNAIGEYDHWGAGHAWQVWSVKATGAAIFGEPKSPKPTGKEALTGWHEAVEFIMDKDTDPKLVGAHTVTAATRIEANIAGASKTDLAGSKAGGDGGVAITGEFGVPDPKLKPGKDGKVADDYHVFYGRLGSNPWMGWKPATKPAG